jgi:phage tail-like protein
MMTEFSVNTHRFDPYKNFKFRVKWKNKYVPGIFRVSGLNRTTAVVEHRDGGDANLIQKSPGATTFAPLTLERARTHDTAFEDWADKVWQLGAALGNEVALKNYRRDIVIEILNEAGQLAFAWNVYRCWPQRYDAFVDLDANGDDILIERLVLAHEGFQRDLAVTEPTEK